MLISAIPPTLPWLITGPSAGLLPSPMACRFYMQPSRLAARLSARLRHGCFSKHAKVLSPFPLMHLCVMYGCWSVDCLYLMFSLLFFDGNQRSNRLCIDNSFTCAVTQCKLAIFLSLPVIPIDSQTAFQYTRLQIIISHQTPLSNALLRILHRNEICPLSMNRSPVPHLWLHLPSIRGRRHRKLLLASPVNQTASWKRINFPRCTFSL